MRNVPPVNGNDGSVSLSVVEAVAEAEGVAPEALTPPLYEAIDPDALERVFAATSTSARMDGQVTFSYNGYAITVQGDGSVALDPEHA
jgi:hypothetical protein